MSLKWLPPLIAPALLAALLVALAACGGDGQPNTPVPAVATPATPTEAPTGGHPSPTAAPGVAATGKIAFVSHRDGNFEIYIMNADGSDQTNLTNNSDQDLEPAWSPDGTRIAFVSDRDGDRGIWVMNADGSDQTRLIEIPIVDPKLAWSPDGEKIAFSSSPHGLAPGAIHVMSADGSDVTQLTLEGGLGPTWSPDGSRIAFNFPQGGTDDIFVMNADGSEQTNLTNHPAIDFRPAWSPDGSRIAFASYDRDELDDEIYVMNADGSGLTPLTDNLASDVSPAWSPDGSHIAFASERVLSGPEAAGCDRPPGSCPIAGEVAQAIHVMGADGSNVTPITDNPWNDFSPAWQPVP